jgi:hypothetical protein
VRLSKGLGLGLMPWRGGSGSKSYFYDHRRASYLGEGGGAIFPVSVLVSFGLYFYFPIDDGVGIPL